MTRHWTRPVTAPCNVTRSSGIMTLNSPGGSTLQCDKCLWEDMPLNSPKRPPYWNYTSGFDFDHIITVDMSYLRQSAKIYPNRTTSAEKRTSCRFSRWRIYAILDFRGPIMGSLKSPCTTSYRSSVDTIALNCLVFEKKSRFCILSTDRQTNEQMDSAVARSRCRCRERRLNNTDCVLVTNPKFRTACMRNVHVLCRIFNKPTRIIMINGNWWVQTLAA